MDMGMGNVMFRYPISLASRNGYQFLA